MRILNSKEKKKRGCECCTDCKRKKIKAETKYIILFMCSHDSCPYHELDKYDTYDDFLQSEDARLPFDRLFDCEKL